MSRLLSILLTALLLLSPGVPATGVSGASAKESCDAAATAFNQARSGGNLDGTIASYQALTGAGCSEELLYCAGIGVALSYVDAAYGKADDTTDIDSIRQELLAGKAYGSPWQLLVGLADLTTAKARADKNGAGFTEAAGYYQDALNTISEPPICTDASGLPSNDEIGSIHKRMTEALLLAPQFEVVRTRAGTCGGVFLASIRGFTPTYRPLPINFEFDKAEFTAAGKQAADQLLQCLIEEHPDRVVLSGHTDMKGPADYNMELSKRRLASVEKLLRDGGFTGELVLMPMGETEPFEADDPSQYTEQEIDQLNRRVALRSSVE